MESNGLLKAGGIVAIVFGALGIASTGLVLVSWSWFTSALHGTSLTPSQANEYQSVDATVKTFLIISFILNIVCLGCGIASVVIKGKAPTAQLVLSIIVLVTMTGLIPGILMVIGSTKLKSGDTPMRPEAIK
jgi:hypothetical protein